MIVKDESHIIKETLTNILEYMELDYWVISDTGSTDNTKQIIKNFFKNKNIPGELFEDEWKDFGHNRSVALSHAYNKTDYLFIFDADDKIRGNLVIDKEKINIEQYDLRFGKEFTYVRPLLITNRKRWIYEGVLHEYLSSLEPITSNQILPGDYYIESRRLGARSSHQDKYEKDATILTKAFEEEKKEGLKNRYAFYAAQSYKDCNQIDKAIEWYKKVLTLNNWDQEKYYSCLMVGDLYKRQNLIDNANSYYFKTVEYDKSRIEGIVNLCKYYYEKENHLLVHLLCNKFNNNYIDYDKKLFIDLNMYNDELDYYNSISSYYIDEKENGYKSLKKVLINKKVNDIKYEYSIKNIKFYKDLMENDIEGDILNEKVNKYFENKNLDL